MRHPTVLVAALLAAGLASAVSAAEPVRTGSYDCEAGRAAGIQGSNGRHAGRIELPDGEQAFSVEIRRLAANRPGCRAPKAGSTTHRTSHEAWWQCGAAFELELSPRKYPSPLRSDDGYIFHDRLSGWLHLADDLRYVFAYTDFRGNYFVEEGRCGRD